MVSARESAKQVICEIIAASGGQLAGKLRLYKAFYYAHLYYWRSNRGTMTDYPIVRMPLGPGIDDCDALLEELEQEGRIKMYWQDNGPYKEQVVEITQPVEIDPRNPRFHAIESAVKWICAKSAAELSEETHLYSRSWRESADGDVMDIYLDILDDAEYKRVKQGISDAEGLLSDIFN